MFNSCAKRRRTDQEHDSGTNNEENTNNNPSSTTPMMLPSIFVKIPLEINQQYQQNRRQNNLIKSEVKFERFDPTNSNLKTPTPPASTPTPPANSSTPERPLSLPGIHTIPGTSFVITGGSDNSRGSNSSSVPEIEKQQPPAIYRCELCPFISICEDNLYSHIDEHTQRKFLRKKYFCPGCDNVHYEKAALEAHFIQDHAMTTEETQVLVDYVLKYNSFGPSRKGRGKGRISIKNATQLKKPDLLLDNGQEGSSHASSQAKPQKIFVKSVQYLKGPEFCFNSQSSHTNSSFETQTDMDPFQFHSTEPTPPLFSSIFNTIPMQDDSETPYFDSNGSETIDEDNIIEYSPIVLPVMSTSDMTTTPPVESTPKPSTSGKIYLKDISVLQDPRPTTIEEPPPPLQQPTIHLKTVDELNAMAFNPNLTLASTFNNFNIDTSLQDCFGSVNSDIIQLDETGISDLIELNTDDSYSQNSFTELLNHDFENVSILDDSKKADCPLASTSKVSEALNVSEFNKNSENTSNHEQNDKDLSFVYAQEIINSSNLEATNNKIVEIETPVPIMRPIESKPRIYISGNLRNDFIFPSPKVQEVHSEPTPIPSPSPELTPIPEPTASNETLTTQTETFVVPKSKIGRPKGARKSGVSQWRKSLPENVTEDDVLGPKCLIDGCGLRFKISQNMDYHRNCHKIMENGQTVCPECQSKEFKNWNTLHTHLWRTHTIDMELYACDKCSFKTPILARLKSEHMKIHSDAHEYKCGMCGRAFKNAKQRKHHVRMHRLRNIPTTINKIPSPTKPKKRLCSHCPMTFANTVALESHIIDFHTTKEEKVSVPEPIITPPPKEVKKYQCPECNYESNDHNAFRRHKFQHSKDSFYKCPFCPYSSIQSTTYRRHLEKLHPEDAANYVFKCQYIACKFTTISKQKFECHVTKHKSNGDELNESANESSTEVVSVKTTKIKVREIITLTNAYPTQLAGLSFIQPAAFATLDNEIRTSTEEMQNSELGDNTSYVTIGGNTSDSL